MTAGAACWLVLRRRHGLVVATASGAWGCWAPLWDPAGVLRLQALQRLMWHALPHAAGLNPRAFRCAILLFSSLQGAVAAACSHVVAAGGVVLRSVGGEAFRCD